MTNYSNTLIVGALAALAFIVGIGFIRGRKVNWKLTVETVEFLEKELNPKEKVYTWIGGYIGFTAEYMTDYGKIRIVQTLLPRHAILWLWISKIIRGCDTVFMIVESPGINSPSESVWKKRSAPFLASLTKGLIGNKVGKNIYWFGDVQGPLYENLQTWENLDIVQISISPESGRVYMAVCLKDFKKALLELKKILLKIIPPQ